MERRDLLRTGATVLAAGLTAGTALAQTAAPAAAPPGAAPKGAAAGAGDTHHRQICRNGAGG